MTSPETPSTMLAVTTRRYGNAEAAVVEEMPVPSPAPDQVLIRVVAAGLNAAEMHLLHGTPYLVRPVSGFLVPKNPVPGQDIAGVVEAVGADCTEFEVGDRVFGQARSAFAQYAVAKATSLVRIPDSVTFAQAASLPIAGCTALQALNAVGVQDGMKILINGASGGVGTFATQIAVARGATVIATCGSTNAQMVASLGASEVLNYHTDKPLEAFAPYDAIVDVSGGLSNFVAPRRVVPGGKVVKIGFTKGKFIAPLFPIIFGPFLNIGAPGKLQGLFASAPQSDLKSLIRLTETGQISPVIERVYPLREIQAAFARLETRRTAGKLVLGIHGDAEGSTAMAF